MKKLLSVLLIVCFLISLAACTGEKDPSSGAETTKTAETETQTETQTELKELTEDEIKQRAVELSARSDESGDPCELFSYFDGDFEITGISEANETIQSIKRKDAITVATVPYMKYYGIEASGYTFWAVSSDDGYYTEMVGAVPLSIDASESSTVFTAFGLDTSALYGESSEDDSDEEEYPKLTAKMLTVNKEKTLCTFSKEYMDALATYVICDSMEFTEEETETFLLKYKGSGTYSVAENEISIEITCYDGELGNFCQKLRYSVGKNQKVDLYSYSEYSNPSLGFTKPLIQEISCEDVVYEGNKPVSATIESRVADFDRTLTSTFTLNCSDAARPKASAKQTKVVDGYGTTELRMTVDLSASSNQFYFVEERDGEIMGKVRGNRLTFTTPSSFPAVPQSVVNEITWYIEENF